MEFLILWCWITIILVLLMIMSFAIAYAFPCTVSDIIFVIFGVAGTIATTLFVIAVVVLFVWKCIAPFV